MKLIVGFKKGLTLLALIASNLTNSQTNNTIQGVAKSGVLDGVYVQTNIPTKRIISYTNLEEKEVMWSKRVWRKIDLREKINHPLYYPEQPTNSLKSLWDVIRYGVEQEGSLTPYEIIPSEDINNVSFDDDGQFLYPVKAPNGNINDSVYKEKIQDLFYTIETIPVWDDVLDQEAVDENGDPIYKDVKKRIESKDVMQYLIKEDWFFDKQRSVMDVRIIGICPLVRVYDDNGVLKPGLQKKFWLYFPECRYTFQNYFVYNRKNDAQRMSFDDLFWKRMFGSFIHKESNVYNRAIESYEKDGVRALLEAHHIKAQMGKIEHDLWHL